MAAQPPWLAVHPLSPEDAPGATALRASVAAFKGKLAGTAARAPFDAIMERVAAPPDVTFAADTVGGIPGPDASPRRRVTPLLPCSNPSSPRRRGAPRARSR